MFPLPPSPLTSPSRGIYLIRCFKSISLRDTRVHSRAARDGPLRQRAGEEEKQTEQGTLDFPFFFCRIHVGQSWDNREKRAGAIVSPLSAWRSMHRWRILWPSHCSWWFHISGTWPKRKSISLPWSYRISSFPKEELLKATENSSMSNARRRYLRNASFDILRSGNEFFLSAQLTRNAPDRGPIVVLIPWRPREEGSNYPGFLFCLSSFCFFFFIFLQRISACESLGILRVST